VELLNEVARFVQKNEPDTLKYQITLETKKSGEQSILVIETSSNPFLAYIISMLTWHRYKDKAAMGAHGSTKEFKAFQKKLKDEDLVGGPMQLKLVKNVGGFSSRLWRTSSEWKKLFPNI
jgi:hypothetical protein